MTDWYLLREREALSADHNMAVDSHLLELMETGELEAPVLRTYAWSKPTLSLGYHQQWRKTVVVEALQKYDIDLVRRWTGGRGVLHDHDEITYSLVAPTRAPFSTRIGHNYKLIGEALATFTDLGRVQAALAEGENPSQVRRKRHLPCFASLSRSEIETRGRKLIGSSQKVGRGAFLQHGSIPLIHRLDVLEEITGSPVSMDGLMTSLQDHYRAAGLECPPREVLISRLIDAFGATFGVHFQDLAGLGLPRPEDVSQIRRQRFAQNDWTYRK